MQLSSFLLFGKVLSHTDEFYQILYVHYSTPAPGHFNDDDTVDFMIHLNYGKWPEYFYSLVRNDTPFTFDYFSQISVNQIHGIKYIFL